MSPMLENRLPPKGARVLVGMSGGVDSSVSAALLVEHGCIVEGGFIKNWSDSVDLWTGECQWRGERRDAIRVAAKLGIPLHTFDFEETYRERVINRMFAEYADGITPNPDVLCNEEIKFGLFFEKAKELGFDYIATGHYARLSEDAEGTVHLLKGADENKDQTYFLHRVSQEALKQSAFPIGHLQKSEVRELATKYALPTAQKPDSQGICFVGKIDFHEFLRKKNEAHPGAIVDKDGKKLGEHDGLDAYTIGQRHGLFVTKESKSWYVAKKNLAKNELIVVNDREDPLMYSSAALLRNVHWIPSPFFPKEGAGDDSARMEATCAIRYRQTPMACTIEKDGEYWRLRFAEPVWALAPGQSAVLYAGDECLGGGFLHDLPVDSRT
jgi:tRNA-specific 2-thiouridylase